MEPSICTVKQAVILVGGRGTRLGELTASIPKPMLEVGGRPFLDYLVETLVRHGFQDILLLAGYQAKQIEQFCAGNRGYACQLRCIVETEALGTGGALRNAVAFLEEDFVVLNGDTLFDFNINDLIDPLPPGALGRLALRWVPDTARYGRVSMNGEILTGLNEKSIVGEGVINGGVYYLSRSVLAMLPDGNAALESDLFPALIAEQRLVGRRYDGFFLDIGIPSDFANAQTLIPEKMTRPAVFLDRDGVINKDKGYVSSADRCEWVTGSISAIKRLNELGFYVFVVTNQAGVARGYYSEEQVVEFHSWMQKVLRKNGAHIDKFYYCPHHPEFDEPCPFRKPEPGMLLKAKFEWPVVWEKSFLIGDKKSDLESARRAGIKGYLFQGGNLVEFVDSVLSSGLM